MLSLRNQLAEHQLSFTQGDDVVMALIALDNSGLPVNLTGATLVSTIGGLNSQAPVVLGNSAHTLGNQSTAPGTFTITLTPTNTAACGAGENKEILTGVTIGGKLATYQGVSILNVYSPVPAQ